MKPTQEAEAIKAVNQAIDRELDRTPSGLNPKDVDEFIRQWRDMAKHAPGVVVRVIDVCDRPACESCPPGKCPFAPPKNLVDPEGSP